MDKEIIYAADPMCSWCYGFAPVMKRIRAVYADRAKMSLAVGGLYAGNRMPLKGGQRRWVLHHWQEVHQRTGQPFNLAFDFPEDFIYDTGPACRAVVAVRQLNPDKEYFYFNALHHEFYVNNHDLTRPERLADAAAELGIGRDDFLRQLDSMESAEATEEDFALCRRFGIDGFPAVLLRDGYQYERLTQGYREFLELQPKIDEWLARD